MTHPPTMPYCGITVILDKPSRHDTKTLISGYAGEYFNKALYPILRQQCDIRTLDEKFTLLPGTKSILLLGNDSLSLVTNTSKDALMRLRGSPFIKNNITYIPTFAPQDAYDRKDYLDEDNPEESSHETTSEKNFQKTKRTNWKWWMTNDIRKLTRINTYGIIQRNSPEINYYPNFDEFSRFANDNLRESTICFDIETNSHRQITCIGIGNCRQCFVIPFIRYDNTRAYDKLTIGRFLCKIAGLFNSNNIIVGHNISGFDLIVLAHYYGICLPRNIYDTMLAHHRMYPELEKSLGHCISLYLDEMYHKDEGNFNPHNHIQEQQLWTYNAKDVIRTLQIYESINLRAKNYKGAVESIEQANRSIRVYCTATLQGARINAEELKYQYDTATARVEQLKRILNIICRRNINANSWQQVEHYLYDLLGYKKPDKDTTSKKQLYKLYAKTGIPSIRVILAIRNTRKKASDLQFTLWKNDRFTCSWKIAGTNTFRLASSALFKFGNDEGYGSNFQNWNKKRRKMLVADED